MENTLSFGIGQDEDNSGLQLTEVPDSPNDDFF